MQVQGLPPALVECIDDRCRPAGAISLISVEGEIATADGKPTEETYSMQGPLGYAKGEDGSCAMAEASEEMAHVAFSNPALVMSFDVSFAEDLPADTRLLVPFPGAHGPFAGIEPGLVLVDAEGAPLCRTGSLLGSEVEGFRDVAIGPELDIVFETETSTASEVDDDDDDADEDEDADEDDDADDDDDDADEEDEDEDEDDASEAGTVATSTSTVAPVDA